MLSGGSSSIVRALNFMPLAFFLINFLAAPIGRFEPTRTGSFYLVRQRDQIIEGSNAGKSGPCQTIGHRIVLSFEIK